ncbi:hypothetical protein Dimus_006333 [Dionaea muscipula]
MEAKPVRWLVMEILTQQSFFKGKVQGRSTGKIHALLALESLCLHPRVILLVLSRLEEIYMFASVPKGKTTMIKCTLHNWNDEQCIVILKNCYNALPENDKLIVMDFVLPMEPDGSWADKHRGGQERTARQGPGELVQAISGCKLLGEVQNYEFHANEPTNFDRPEFVEESAIRPLKMAKISMLVDMEFPALTLLWPNDSRSTELIVDPKRK